MATNMIHCLIPGMLIHLDLVHMGQCKDHELQMPKCEFSFLSLKTSTECSLQWQAIFINLKDIASFLRLRRFSGFDEDIYISSWYWESEAILE